MVQPKFVAEKLQAPDKEFAQAQTQRSRQLIET